MPFLYVPRCMVEPEVAKTELLDMRARVALNYTWIIVFSKPLTFFFLVWVAYKYGHIKLGKKDEEPEYSGITYFAMLFAAGVAVGIFYFGVSEPLGHSQSMSYNSKVSYSAGNWFVENGYMTQDEMDQFAMTQTIFHWGLAAWSVYLVVALGTALASFRFRLPLTFRSCFYPLLGDYTWGWIGDVIDGFSIVVTVSGVCTSLGLGAMQIAAGLQRIGWVDKGLSGDEMTDVQTAIIWIVTVIATISVMTGLDVGIKYLSMFAFCLGMILTFVIMIMDRTNYLLNLMVQTIGHFFQFGIWLLPFHADAFGQLREGEGRTTDVRTDEWGEGTDAGAAAWWFDAWTIFYVSSKWHHGYISFFEQH